MEPYQSRADTKHIYTYKEVQLIYDTCLVCPLLEEHVSVQLAPENREVTEAKGVTGHSPSARSPTVASRFSSGRDGFALGEE